MNSPSGPVNKATQSGEWESFLPGRFRFVLFAVPHSPFIGTYKQSKETGLQEHSLLLRCLPFFLCCSFSECSSLCRNTTGFVLLSRELFHSVPAIMNAFHPVSLPWIDMTVLLKNLKFFVHFLKKFISSFFFLSLLSCRGGGGHASHETRMYNDKGKNKLLLRIIM